MRVLLETFGCTLNRGEAEEFRRSIEERGCSVVEAAHDVAVVFTCGVIETTERKVLKRLEELDQLQRPIIVCGCLGSMNREQVLRAVPEATIYGPWESAKAIEKLKTV